MNMYIAVSAPFMCGGMQNFQISTKSFVHA